MTTRRKNLILALLPVVIIPLAYLIIPQWHRIGLYLLPCPTLTLFHIYCPGCGGTRAVYALFSGDIISALKYNLLVPAAALCAVFLWLENVFAALGKKIKLLPRSGGFKITAFLTAAVYVILRNIIPFLAP